jgi:hypothetical protein
MDQRKALFRAKLREAKEKQEKRIDPSLVRSGLLRPLFLPPPRAARIQRQESGSFPAA